MTVRTVGVEEEFLLLDPERRIAVPRVPSVLQAVRERDRGVVIEHELFRHQVEIQSDPVTTGDELSDQLLSARATAAAAAADVGLSLAAGGVSPLASPDVVTTNDDRYRAMVDTFGDVAREGGTCGMHVHVAVDSDDEAVHVVDGVGPWLSAMLALSVNSPFAEGRDTGYASWRSRQWSQWPTAGPTQRFGDVSTYRRASRALIDAGAARDEGMLYYDARLARDFPTVEIRVCDVQTDLDDAVCIALLVRALVTTIAEAEPDPGADVRLDILRAGRWRAARDGLSGSLLDPREHAPRPAGDVIIDLLDLVEAALEEAGDRDTVHRGIERLMAATGAARQRAAFERTGTVEGVVDDLVERTRLSIND